MRKRISTAIIALVFVFVFGLAMYDRGYSRSGADYSNGFSAGYKHGIITVMEALHNIKGAEVHYGNLTISADYSIASNMIFLYAEPCEYAIKLDSNAKKYILIKDNLVKFGR